MITVGVAAFNAAGTLVPLLESLAEQDYPPDQMEIVVADNGSTDDTPGLVHNYAGRLPIRLVPASRRRGPAVARNEVIGNARGEIIAFTDADCIVHPAWLAEISQGFRDAGVGCVAGAVLPAEPETPAERFYVRREILKQEPLLAHPFLPYALTANAAFRRQVFDQVGLFDEDLITGEDADLQWRMQLETNFRLCYRPDAIVWHKHRGTDRGLLRQAKGWGLGETLLYKKYHGQLPRNSPRQIVSNYRRIAGLASLTLRRWVGVKTGRVDPDALEDSYLSLLFWGGYRLGRLKGSLAARVFYP